MIKNKAKRFDEKIDRKRRDRKLVAAETAEQEVVVRQIFSSNPVVFRKYGAPY